MSGLTCVFTVQPQTDVAYLATGVRKMIVFNCYENLSAESWRECVHTEVPLMLQDTDGFGDPSTSQTKTLCWPSSPRCLDSCRITGAPVTGRNRSQMGLNGQRSQFSLGCRTSSFKVHPLVFRAGRCIKKPIIKHAAVSLPTVRSCHLPRRLRSEHNCLISVIKKMTAPMT